MGKADLHIHSTASDGACSPEELIRHAAKKRLSTVAITDHDTLDGYFEALAFARRFGVELLSGVEITVLADKAPIHLLAYEFDPEDREMKALMVRQRRARIRRMESILDSLRKNHAIGVSLDEVKAQARGGNLGRPHLAAVMIRKKWVASQSEAFIRYLGQPDIAMIEAAFESLEEVIRIVREAGGVTVIAHPGPFLSMDRIRELTVAGVDGVECLHPSHDFSMQKKLIEYAEKNHLLVTGGSDFHGDGEAYTPWFGILTLSQARVQAVKRMANNRKRLNLNRV